VSALKDDTNTFVTGFTYDNNNTFTINDNTGSAFTATINQVSGLTVNGTLSATTLDGNTILSGGTNLITIIDDRDNYVTGTTFGSNQSVTTTRDGIDVLKISGGTNVTLSNPSGNQIKIDVTPNVRNISTTQSVLTTDGTLNCTGGTITVTLPTAVGVTGKEYIIKNSGASSEITVDTTAPQTIDGSTSILIKRQYLSRRLQSNGLNWIVI